MQIKDVMEKNPFRLIVDRWKDDLEQFDNGQREVSDLNFILDGDLSGLSEARRNAFKKELLPKPFQGNPNAPIWYVPINPSYSPIDLYDNLGLCPGCNEKLVPLCKGHSTVKNECCLDEYLDNGKDRMVCLKARQNILLEQLLLRGSNTFSFLEKAFDTLGTCPTHKNNGGFRWWRNHLFGRNCLFEIGHKSVDYVSKKLFVLETCPYHLKTGFDTKYYDGSIYFNDFWKELVKWGIDNGKMFILRPRGRKFKEATANIGFTPENTVNINNVRNASISFGNIIGKHETIEMIRAKLNT